MTVLQLDMSIKFKRKIFMEVTVRLVLWFLFVYFQNSDPFIRIIQPEEWWLYRYPLTGNYVSTQLLWFITLFIPGSVLIIEYIIKRNKQDTFEAILCATLIYTLNGFLTSYIKVLVGRPRPDFYERCMPDTTKLDNLLHCAGPRKIVMEGRKSFPSGHSSFSFCSMMFLFLYLAGKLQVFNQNAKTESWKFIVCLLPLIVAITVAISRTCDYHHHWQDVVAGALLGSTLAYSCYYLYFPSLLSNYSNLSYEAHNSGIEN